MAGNWFSKVRSWLMTSTMAGVRRTKSYNRCRPVASRWFVGSSSRIATGECNSMPARKIRVFSPPLNPSIRRERGMPSIPQADKAAWARSSIFQSSFSVVKCLSDTSPFRMACKASNLPSILNACAMVRSSYCPKC